MKHILQRDGAKIVHPDKAFIVRHIKPTFVHERVDLGLYLESGQHHSDPEIEDYILKCHQAAETLFGDMDFALHSIRQYTKEGLAFHQDFGGGIYDDEDDDEDGGTIIRMVSCVHNICDLHRPLTFRRKLDTGHTEQFDITIPAGTMLLFGDGLMFDYEHGILPSEEAAQYVSVLTRFQKVIQDG